MKIFKSCAVIINILPTLAITLTVMSCSSRRSILLPGPVTAGENKQVEDTRVLIILYDASVGKDALMKAVSNMKCKLLYDYKTFNAIAVKLPDGAGTENAMKKLETVKGVINVQRNSIMRLDSKTRPAAGNLQ